MIALLVESASRTLALGGLVGLALFALRARNPHLQKTVWRVVLLAALAMPFILEWRMAPRFDAPSYLLTLTDAGERAAPHNAMVDHWLATVLAALSMRTVTLVYSAIALALLTRFALGFIGVWRIRRAATPMVKWPMGHSAAEELGSDSDIRVSTRVKSPATFGSTILLPASVLEWSEEKLLAVLCHERSHVRHCDSYVQWLSCLHACVFWFNPLAWWLHRRLADLAESTSDDAVLRALPDRTAYASLLLDIAREPVGASVIMSAARSNVAARIERIISNTPPQPPLPRRIQALAAISLLPLLAVAAATLQTTTPTPTPPPGSHGAMEPKLIDYGRLEDLQEFYPKEAKRAGVETIVSVQLTLDATGSVVEAEAIDPTASDIRWGFPDAAVAVAKTLKFRNTSGGPEKTNLRVKFALER